MKILSVRAMNIHSLAGNWEIRFDRPPLSDAGIFAITGPTGAGKTTILDAITLGLYGLATRYGNERPENVMSRHTAECFSEVEFEAGDGRYRSKWSLRRARKKTGGAIQPAKMELVDLNDGSVMESRIAQVKAAVERITGLDIKRFLRSAMLAQGEFAAFLRASEKERGELLERITGTEVYAQISKFAHEKARDEAAELQKLEESRGGIPALTEEERITLQEALRKTRNEAIERRDSLEKLLAAQRWFENIAALERETAELDTRRNEFLKMRTDHQTQLERLQRHEAGAHLQGDLARLDVLEAQAQRIDRELEQLNVAASDLHDRVQAAKAHIAEKQKTLHTARTAMDEAEPRLEAATRADAAIEREAVILREFEAEYAKSLAEQQRRGEERIRVETELAEARADRDEARAVLAARPHDEAIGKDLPLIRRAVRDLDALTHRRDRLAENATRADERLLEHQNVIERLGAEQIALGKQRATAAQELESARHTFDAHLEGTDAQALEASAAELRREVDILRERERLSAGFQRQTRAFDEAVAAASELDRRLEREREKAAALDAEHKSAADRLTDIRKIARLERLVAKYEEDRSLLEAGAPCPLCGSLHHPYQVDETRHNAADAERDERLQEEAVAEVNAKVKKQEGIVAALAADARNLERERVDHARALQLLRDEFDALPESPGSTIDIAATSDIHDNHKRRSAALEHTQATLAQVQTARTTVEERRDALRSAESNEAAATNELEKAELLRAQAAETLRAARAEFATTQTDCEQSERETREIILPYEISPDATSSWAEVVQMLEQREREFLAAREREAKATRLCERLEAEATTARTTEREREAETAQRELKARDQTVALETARRERLERYGALDPQTERAQLRETVDSAATDAQSALNAHTQMQAELASVKELQTAQTFELRDVNAAVKKLLVDVETAAHNVGFTSVDDVRSALLDAEEQSKLVRLRDRLQREEHGLETARKDLRTRLDQERAKALTDRDAEGIRADTETARTAVSQLERDIGAMDEKLRHDDEQRAKARELSQRIDAQRSESQRWQRLNALIGSYDGAKFSRFAQSLTLEKLIALANRHLLKLNERYRLRKAPGQDLELEVIDRYQADAIRPMTSLSGGESFLASLALALGLSDLAGRDCRIQSLFIDEGFGSLDTDTLDMALHTLENLQASGKSIGIISHIESLKERITTQIHVRKESGGISRIILDPMD